MMFVGCIYGDREFGNAEEVVDYEDEKKKQPKEAPENPGRNMVIV